MHTPPIPSDETQRMRALQSLRVLDTLPEERFDRITRLACRLFNVPIALVSLVDKRRQWFKSRQGLDVCETSREVSFCGHAILHERPLIVPDSFQDPRFADNPLVLGEPKVRFYAGHPVHGPEGARIGTLCLIDHVPRTMSQDEVALLADLASMIDHEFSMLEHATTDELTRLSNRRGFNLVANHVLALSRRTGQPATVIGIDLDHFKAINDRHGHEAGDEVLRAFAKMLQKNFRAYDVVARFGGDEFVVLCGGATAQQVQASLTRLRQTFEDSALARRHPDLSWSEGRAQFDPKSDADVEDLLREADQHMYGAKTQARASQRSA